MNSCNFIGRLARDPETRRGGASNSVVSKFPMALDRGKDKDGKDRGADFISVTCFSKTAELVEKYCYKGQLVGIEAHVVTGSYEKNGTKVYTTDFVADRIEFLSKKQTEGAEGAAQAPADQVPEGFSKLTDDDVPF